jgi:hypothetical protein
VLSGSIDMSVSNTAQKQNIPDVKIKKSVS